MCLKTSPHIACVETLNMSSEHVRVDAQLTVQVATAA